MIVFLLLLYLVTLWHDWFPILFCFIIICYMPVCFLKRERGMDPEVTVGREEVAEVGEGGTIIRIYCLEKSLFSIIEKLKSN